VFNPENGFLYFKSSASSRHASYLKQNPYVSGTIQPDKLNLFVVKGIQFEGIILNADENVKKMAAKEYYFQYPVALTMQGDIWIIQLENIRLTDSTIGFGKKIYWNKNEVISES
jgi:uncharacterized protein YhbP (UPF0306 family)